MLQIEFHYLGAVPKTAERPASVPGSDNAEGVGGRNMRILRQVKAGDNFSRAGADPVADISKAVQFLRGQLAELESTERTSV